MPARTVAETLGTTVAGAPGDGGRAVLAPQRRGGVGGVRSARARPLAPLVGARVRVVLEGAVPVGRIRRGSRAMEPAHLALERAAALGGRDVRGSGPAPRGRGGCRSIHFRGSASRRGCRGRGDSRVGRDLAARAAQARRGGAGEDLGHGRCRDGVRERIVGGAVAAVRGGGLFAFR